MRSEMNAFGLAACYPQRTTIPDQFWHSTRLDVGQTASQWRLGRGIHIGGKTRTDSPFPPGTGSDFRETYRWKI